ncbi:MAG: hypothetical protein IKO37_01815 [Prevotella sp.]|nr:hypothetical protein [Prevotella sp.]
MQHFTYLPKVKESSKYTDKSSVESDRMTFSLSSKASAYRHTLFSTCKTVGLVGNSDEPKVRSLSPDGE